MSRADKHFWAYLPLFTVKQKQAAAVNRSAYALFISTVDGCCRFLLPSAE